MSLPDLSPAPPAPFDEQELTLLAGLDYREQDALAASTRLRAAGLDADRAAAVLTQAKLRGEAAAKFGPEAEHLLLTRPGLEQATRRAVAEHHAARLRAAGLGSVADLG
ncbi:SAM-dependent methyltransferase, partial [Rothia kristinae]